MRSTAQFKSHPLHPILIAFPVAFTTAAPAFDLVGVLAEWPTVWAAGAYLATAAVIAGVVAGVPGFIDLEKVITTCPLGPIPVAPLLGVTERIVGGVVSTVAAVVKLLLNPVLEFPARSVTPLTDTLTVALPGKGVSGVNVTTAPLTT